MELQSPTFREAVLYWLRLGFVNFGGPAGQIAMMHTELVERRRWVGEDRFLHALNYCMILPGPEAQQLATYIGWMLHGTRGGIVAGALFILPSAVLIWLLAWIVAAFGNVAWIAALFHGLQIATIAIVVDALFRIGKKSLKNGVMWTVAAVAFVAIYFLKLNFVVIILVAGAVGWLGSAIRPEIFVPKSAHGPGATGENVSPRKLVSRWSTVSILATGLVLWWAPIFLAGALLGWGGTLFQQGLFFSKAALITFGGAYAVLPYVAQTAVVDYGWLSAGQMMSGLALAESTPGPLIMVLPFVGFLGGWNHPGSMSPLLAGTLGAGITTWATFLPSFLLILVGAPFVEKMHDMPRISAALGTITAAVVGVILNLGVWFAWHVIVPRDGTIDFFALLLAAALFAALKIWKWSVPLVVGVGGAAGMLLWGIGQLH